MYSRIRYLLFCQDELAQLQKRLLEQDDNDASDADSQLLLLSRKRYEHRNSQSPRHAIIKKIGIKLEEFGKHCQISSLYRLLTQR